MSSTERPLSACVWGVPAILADLRSHGIVCSGGPRDVAVIGVERDADLEIVRQIVDAPILVLVPPERSPGNAERVVEAIELGVATVLPADTETSRIIATLYELAAGHPGRDVHPLVAELLVVGLRARTAARSKFAITRREREVLELVVEGRTTADIAACLGIGFHTAQTHLKNLFRKLDVGSRAAATSIALRHQLV